MFCERSGKARDCLIQKRGSARGEEIMEKDRKHRREGWMDVVEEGTGSGKCGRLNCRSRLGKSSVTLEIDRILRSRK
jgi:hypothetical protein